MLMISPLISSQQPPDDRADKAKSCTFDCFYLMIDGVATPALAVGTIMPRRPQLDNAARPYESLAAT
jgi:hypothetical protein